MDVGGWLRRLGLEQYEAAFRENAVDAEVLPRLTTDDLKEMGIVPIGHRRRLLDAIAALRLPATPAEAPAQVSSSSTLTEPAGSTAERRPLSVMFCDLIGSTALSARLDPEDLYQRPYPVTVIDAHERWVREAIRSGIRMNLFQASQQASTTAL